MMIQICDWMRGSLLERRTRFTRDQVIESGTLQEALAISGELLELGLNIKLVHSGENAIRIWVDDKQFQMR